MAQSMSLDFGFNGNVCIKRKFRWLLKIPYVCGGDVGMNCLPPAKGARPTLSFKEAEAQHLTETVYFPMKPDWKPMPITLYDLKKNENPVYAWFKNLYDPSKGSWTIPGSQSFGSQAFKQEVKLELYSGCGEIIEKWIIEGCWPQEINFGDLDMSSGEYCTIDMMLRYDRAYLVV
jgi:hypothetical protein